mmetsp:Transcript_24774/g.45413  ORF Transcript_24774/g.45413 Transcript_24774/m.45413 type:complete len:358 (+) Transcript_24774:70-1143(+)
MKRSSSLVMRSAARRASSPRGSPRASPLAASGGSPTGRGRAVRRGSGDSGHWNLTESTVVDFKIEGRRSPLAARAASPTPKASTVGATPTSDQLKAIERLADYPRRVERLKLLWMDIQEEKEKEAGSRRSSLRHSRSVSGVASPVAATPSAPSASGSAAATRRSAVPSGPLTARQIRELMSRDLTPEDYELLLLLDEGVKKAKILSPDVAACLPCARGTAWVDEACSICLCALEEDEDVRMLPACGHCFHAPCAERWLTSSKATCPLCGREEDIQEKVVKAFKCFDTNSDGMFDVADLKRVFTKLDGTWSSEDLDRIFGHMDVNKDGRINTQEFVNWVFAADATETDQTTLRKAMDI